MAGDHLGNLKAGGIGPAKLRVEGRGADKAERIYSASTRRCGCTTRWTRSADPCAAAWTVTARVLKARIARLWRCDSG